MKDKGRAFMVLMLIWKLIPGTYLKTFVYLNCVLALRKLARTSIGTFYRMDHIYGVLTEFKNTYKGKFSVLEFGVADGYSFTKKLYATRYLHMEDRVTVHGFDTFEGLPAMTSSADRSLVDGDDWAEGHYYGRYENLLRHCQDKYTNFEFHKGLFDETLTEEFLSSLAERPPILIWIDCDYYSSTTAVFERIIPFIPTGCVIYFDDIFFNFSSRFTGEMKVIWEINHGKYGEGIELVLDPKYAWDSRRVYRFINVNQERKFELANPVTEDPVRRLRGDSPFP